MDTEQDQPLTHGRKKRRLIKATIILVLIGLATLIPLPIRPADKDRAIDKSISALLTKKRVFLDWKYVPFYDSRLFDFGSTNVYYENDAEISDSVFEEHNISAVSDSSQLTLGPDALIQVTYFNSLEEALTDDLHFAFVHGPLGAQCYRMTVYRNIWGVFVFYRIVWVS